MKWDYGGRERANSYAPPNTQYTCVAQHVIRVWIGPGAQDLESTVTHGFVKHGFKVLLYRDVDGPLQASHCLVLQSLNEPSSLVPGIPVYFGPYLVGWLVGLLAGWLAGWLVGWLVGWLRSQQHASASQRRICSGNCTFRHSETQLQIGIL